MATVTELVDHAIAAARLQTTGAERTSMLRYLNDAYQRAVEEAGSYVDESNIAVVAGTSDYDLSGDVLMILSVRVDAGFDSVLTMLEDSDLLALRANNTATGTVRYYSIAGDNIMRFFPTPDTADTLTYTYVKEPLTLVESSPVAGTSESTPTAIRKRFHYSVLANGAIALAFEFMQDQEQAELYWGRYRAGMADLVRFTAQFAGLGGAGLGRLTGDDGWSYRYRDSY